jgi:hypothetical protein
MAGYNHVSVYLAFKQIQLGGVGVLRVKTSGSTSTELTYFPKAILFYTRSRSVEAPLLYNIRADPTENTRSSNSFILMAAA